MTISAITSIHELQPLSECCRSCMCHDTLQNSIIDIHLLFTLRLLAAEESVLLRDGNVIRLAGLYTGIC